MCVIKEMIMNSNKKSNAYPEHMLFSLYFLCANPGIGT